MGILGSWDVRIKTPIGSLAIAYTFTERDGGMVGHATGRGETVPLRHIAVRDVTDGQQVTWHQSVTRPMRLHLDFDVVVTGDRLIGYSRAGRLPRSAVTGARRTI